ncbi:adhesion G protein-coupled receptor L3, partial [Biomphalaria glabrata]
MCNKRCNGSVEVTTQQLSNVQCNFCSCLRPACEIYDNCCPDVSVPIYQIEAISGDGMADSQSNQIESQNSSITEIDLNTQLVPRSGIDCTYDAHTFLFVALCPSNYKENTTIVDLCERNLDQSELTLDTFVKVKDNSTGVVYKNKFCAICHRISQ